MKHDPHSFAAPERVAVRHVALDLTVDFTQHVLHGKARLSVTRHDPRADLVLDADGLGIEAVTECATQRPLRWELAPARPILGQALTIALAAEACVEIAYRTGPDAGALLWVEPSGTSGKREPMLFTQSQAIHARTWIPLQDTPGVRFTYEATIHVPDGLWAVMSAENPQRPPADGVWRFAMAQPIPSYLMALAVGDFAFRAIGPRSGVYAEPSVVDAAAREFTEVEAMMATAERLYGPYRWGRYDMLVLPPSFPYGGMENPRLTFLTPTVITGDRALVSLIAHELAHSWSGNLVTNSTWSDFWLNEGFTTYVERRIMEALRGTAYADELWYLGRKDLVEAFGTTARPDTRLALEIAADRDPDDVPSDAAYEKGALFLRTLEQAFGRATFDQFLRRRFERRALQSTDTGAFEAEAAAELLGAHPGAMSAATFASWIHDPGLPGGGSPASSPRVTELEALAAGYARTGTAIATRGWQTLDWVIFLRALPADLARDRLLALDPDGALTSTTNAEIAMYWLPRLVRADARAAAPAVEAFLLRVGRRRMVTPIYEAMVSTGEPWRALAKQTFERARALYHPITRDKVAAIVGP
jgi:aminopeptidase N